MKNLTIHCKDFDLTDAIKEYAEDKIKMLDKYLKDDGATTFSLRMGKTTNHHNSGKIYYAELSVAEPHKHYDAKIEADDIYAAIDIVKDEMANNIKNHKDRARTVSRHDAQKFKEKMQSTSFE